MNGLTILLWITIFIIGVIAIIAVKLHYRGSELEKDENSIIPTDTIDGLISFGQEKISNSNNNNNPKSLSPQSYNTYDYPIEEVVEEKYDIYEAPKTEDYSYDKVEYESQNQVLINYKNEVEKFQEPMTQSQVEIMTQDNEKHELKDLFTIDELIKESKRKDSEREKEAQQINKDDDDLTEIKESIRRRKENEDVEDSLIEEILADEEIGEILSSEETVEEKSEPTIQDIINESESKAAESVEEAAVEETSSEPTIESIIEEKPEEETIQNVLDVEEQAEESVEEENVSPSEIEAPSQKDIAEAIDNASQEIEENEIESISESDNITDVLLNSEQEAEEEIIKEPVLKSPTKIDDTQNDDLSAPIDDSNLTEPVNDLDYRKDLAKITNTIKGSKLFQDVKERLTGEPEEEIDPIEDLNSSYIRNVNEYEEEYDEYAPIINETHDEFGEIYEPETDYDQVIREENTRRLMNNSGIIPEPEIAKPKIETIKSKPSRENIKIQLGNADVVLKKGDEIIFKHDGETYSSQVYAINGDDISVRYRRKDIVIKPEDVKKIY
ncbi:ATPase [Methanobrevibacter sp.]|uniref:ATPase n=1 Tax=Methanobrevibacter sp. TaxID=66852 RepID=UPI00388EDC88